MERYWNNKGKILLSPKFLALCSILLALCIVLCLLLYPNTASSGPYLDSAHANTSYGVNRSGLSSFGYSIGNCAHCHEQHASIGGSEPAPVGGAPSKYELFQSLFTDQSSTFCFGCHKDPGVSSQYLMPNQYNYSRIAGGDTNICPFHIKQTFQFVNPTGASQSNCNSSVGSSHFLADIRTVLAGSSWNFGSTTGNINPCSGCHNPHRAQRDYDSGGFQWATNSESSLSLPSHHSKDNNAWDLWGDVSTERMSNYSIYQAPYRYNSTTTYEPDGFGSDGSGNASRNVDSVAFCLGCHANSVNSTYRGALTAINWGPGGDAHGVQAGPQCVPSSWGTTIAPYAANTNYVLSCLDCHEPHGSPNGFLLRQEVNGKQVPTLSTAQTRSGSNYLYFFCTACHTVGTDFGHVGSPNECTATCHHYHSGVPVMTPCGASTKMF